MFNDTSGFGENLSETSDRLKRRRQQSHVVSIREQIRVSLEFFPPKDEAAHHRLHKVVEELSDLGPDFLSMTYGALGARRDTSISAVSNLRSRSNVPVAAHLTCIGSSAAEMEETIEAFLNLGIRRFVALRGDLPAQADPALLQRSDYRRADQLVSVLRKHGDLDISVATYPEKHPQSSNIRQDIEALLAKQDAGANRAITQFFFDTDSFLKFRDKAIGAGVRIPVVPGVLPVYHFGNTCRFAKGCGAGIPHWMHDLFDGLDDAPEVRAMVATTVATEQCARLIENGVDHFHFYTLNRADMVLAICRILGLGSILDDTAGGGGQSKGAVEGTAG